MIKKILTNLLAVTLLLGVVPVGASAEWKQNSKGWWYTDGSSWATGWKNINGDWYFFDTEGYMKTGWISDGSNWYYLWPTGKMASNVIIDDCYINANGIYDKSSSTTAKVSDNKGDIVYVASNGSKYHYKNNCGNLDASKAIELTKSEAVKHGYDECNKCN